MCVGSSHQSEESLQNRGRESGRAKTQKVRSVVWDLSQRLRHVGASVARHQVNNSRRKQAAAFPATLHLHAVSTVKLEQHQKFCFPGGRRNTGGADEGKRQLSRRQ